MLFLFSQESLKYFALDFDWILDTSLGMRDICILGGEIGGDIWDDRIGSCLL